MMDVSLLIYVDWFNASTIVKERHSIVHSERLTTTNLEGSNNVSLIPMRRCRLESIATAISFWHIIVMMVVS